MLKPQFRIVGFPCQGSDEMTQAAGGACCALSYSDVKYEALCYDPSRGSSTIGLQGQAVSWCLQLEFG